MVLFSFLLVSSLLWQISGAQKCALAARAAKQTYLPAPTTVISSSTSYTPSPSSTTAVPEVTNFPARKGSRLDQIKAMYAWEGFVYDIAACPPYEEMLGNFTKMQAMGARTAITFDICGDGADATYYEDIISAAGNAGVNIIPLAWTLSEQNATANDTFLSKSVPRINAVTEAVIKNPVPVLAVALGDEPLYDRDTGTADVLATYILQMKQNFKDAGLGDIPVSISEMAYGYQSTPGNVSTVIDAVDFFMINVFPYFAFDATSGGSITAWNDFLADMTYFKSIAGGKPLLVTQTGWPSNEDMFAPNSQSIVVSIQSEEDYWDLLDGHCEDYFKAENIGWMWRSWDDSLAGWGALYNNGTEKWKLTATRSC